MRVALTTVLDVLGMILLIVAGFAFDWRAGLAVVGVLLLVVSVMLAREEARSVS